jgi:hypothetical protein
MHGEPGRSLGNLCDAYIIFQYALYEFKWCMQANSIIALFVAVWLTYHVLLDEDDCTTMYDA